MSDMAARPVTKEQRAWYYYDWANSAYVTTTAAVLFSPYLTSVAEKAACGFVGDDDRSCDANLDVLGIGISPGSLVFYLVPIITVISAIVLPIVGAMADRVADKRKLMSIFAWIGSATAASMFFVAGDNWQLGAFLLLVANLALASSLVIYDAILIDISTPDERDKISSRGWALGYLGGGLLLAANFLLLSFNEDLGLSTAMAVRICLVTAGVWWAVFTIIPFRGLRAHAPTNLVATSGDTLLQRSFGQLWATLKDLKNYPQTLTFLVAYLIYNDAVQTVIYAASIFGDKELGFETSTVLVAFLVVQFVGVAGALFFGRVAQRVGTKKTISITLLIWMVVVVCGFALPAHKLALFLLLAAGIGLVLGGTQALSRSFYSQLIPRGREAEYFSLYQATERGTSWLGLLLFGVTYQLTDSYRPAILALVVFFVLGLLILSRLRVREGIEQAGNRVPAVI
ncbi:MAG: transporter [Nocardioidaceae bacterium]|nr:transporter [Nocardioidaceae bacterium]